VQCFAWTRLGAAAVVLLVGLGLHASTLTLRTTPPGAQVAIDGRPAGTSDASGRLELKGLPAGTYSFRFSHQGYPDKILPIEVDASADRQVDVTLAEVPTHGSLRVAAGAPGVAIFLDERPIGLARADGSFRDDDAPLGEHVLRLRRSGYQDFVAGVSIDASPEPREVVAAWEPSAPPPSTFPLSTLLGVALLGLGVALGGFALRRRADERRARALAAEEGTPPDPEGTVLTQPGSKGPSAPRTLEAPFRYDSLEALVGRVVDGRYRVDRVLGMGGMGAVFVAYEAPMGRHVALKVIHPRYSNEIPHVTRFMREIKISSKLHHPNIVTSYHSSKTEDGILYIAMELVQGEDLAKLLKAHAPLPVDHACDLFQQIARALEEAHALNIVHRDLKPGNILVSRDRKGHAVVKLLDFGLAKCFDLHAEQSTEIMLTGAHAVMGTPPYMSPEQCKDSGSVDHRSDIYSLGLILYEMLTGRSPYRAASAIEYIAAHVTSKPDPVSDHLDLSAAHVSEALDRAIMKALEKDPTHRYQRVADFREDVVGAIQGEQTVALS